MTAILAVATSLIILLALAGIAQRGIVPQRRGVIAPFLGVAAAAVGGLGRGAVVGGRGGGGVWGAGGAGRGA